MATRGTVMPSLAFAAVRRGRRTFLPLCPAPRALATIRLQQNGMGLRCVQGRARFGKASCPGEGEADETEIRSICASIGLRASGTYSTHVHLVGCTVQLLRPTCVTRTRRKAFGSIGGTPVLVSVCLVVAT
jgi:hypothetical protein